MIVGEKKEAEAPKSSDARVVGTSREQQILADHTSCKPIRAEFWTELKAQKLIEQNAPVAA